MSETFTRAGAVVSAAHRSRSGVLHGHTWQVWVTAPRQDATKLQRRLRLFLATIDHSELPDELAEGEDLAQYVAAHFDDCIRVDVCRPLEMIEASWIR